MTPGTLMFAFAMLELMRAIHIVRRWSDDRDFHIALSRMNLGDFGKLQSRVLCSFILLMTAQILGWLP